MRNQEKKDCINLKKPIQKRHNSTKKNVKTKGKIQILKPKYIGDTVGLKPLWDDGEQWEDKRNFFVKIDQKRLLQPIYKKAQNGPKNSRFINWNTKI